MKIYYLFNKTFTLKMPAQVQFNPVVKNIISVTVSHFLLKMVSAILTIVIARYLGVKELGYYATAVSFASLTGIITNAGFRDILIKNISINRENIKEYISSAIFLQFILSSVVYLIMIFISGFFNYESIVIKLIYIGGAAAFFSDIIEFLFAYYYGIQRMEKIAFFRFIYSISIIILICTIIFFNKGLITITLANLTVAIFVTILLLASIIKETGFKVAPDLFLPIFKEALPFGLNIIYNIAYTRVGIVLLSVSAGAYTVGLFDSSLKIITLLGIIPGIILTSIYPVLFRLGTTSPGTELNNQKDYRQILNLTIRYLSFIGFPVSTFMFIYSTEISILIYGNTFTDAGFILRILSFTFAFQCISYPLSDALATRNKQKIRTRITGIAFIITLMGNLIFIPLSGALGTAFVMLFTEFFLLVVLLYYVKNLIFEVSILNLAGKHLLSSVLTGLLLYFFIYQAHNLMIGFLIGILTYGILSGLVNFSLIKDWQKR